METFIYWTAGLMALDAASKLYYLGSGSVMPRTSGGMALDCLFNVGFIIWAVNVVA